MSERTHTAQVPSEWVCRFAGLIAPGGRVVDVACGHGRHTRYLQRRGLSVIAVDCDFQALVSLRGLDRVQPVAADLESHPWPLRGGTFDAVIVTNYLWRPLLADLVAALREGGVFIYETFALGNERFGRPTNPDFLLRPNELLERLMPQLEVVAFEQGQVARPARAVIQRICAVHAPRTGMVLDPA